MKSIWPGLVLITAIVASSQPRAQTADRNADPLAPVVELPPRYQVEFILFAHNRFESTEEHFDIVPAESRFAAANEPIPLRFFDADARLALRELIEGPISAPALDETEQSAENAVDDALTADTDIDSEPVLEAWLDPALVEGPATRYLELHELSLLPTLDRLDRLDAYTPLVHSGWEQNGLAEADAVAIDLAEFGSANPRGTIQLHVSRYLHISVDLAYHDAPITVAVDDVREYADAPLPASNPPTRFGFGATETAAPAGPDYYLLEQRRMLRGELNYFDHPAFGLLLKITLAPERDDTSATQPNGPSA